MRPIVIVLIVVALALAGGAAYLVSVLLSRQPEVEVTAVEPTETQVLVAAGDLPTGAILQDDDLAWRAWPQDGVQSDYILRPSDGSFGDFPGSAVRAAIRSGEPITATRVFKRSDAGFLAGALGPGMRAVSISVDEVSGAAGFVLPGDRVDIIMTQRFNEFDEQTENNIDRFVVQTILENVRVLAIDQVLNDVEENSKSAKTVTIEATPSESEVVALAKRMGDLTLALRSLTRGEQAPLEPFQADYNVSRYLGRQIQTSNRVLVAARDLQPGELLREPDLGYVTVSARDLVPGHYIEGASDVLRLRGALVMTPVAKGAFLTAAQLSFPDEDSFLINALQQGMRAYSIPISPQALVSGRISVGDRVDVILTTKVIEQGGLLESRTFSETVLENVRIVAIDRTFDASSKTWILGQTATLEVTSKGAETLAAAQAMGSLSVALRGQGPTKAAGDYTTDFEVSRAMTAFVWGQTVPLPPGFEDTSGDADADADAQPSSEPVLPNLAPIPAPTLAPLAPEAAAPAPTPGTAYSAPSASRSVKVFRGGGETTYEFSE